MVDMKPKGPQQYWSVVLFSFLIGLVSVAAASSDLDVGERFVDAFYSYDTTRLAETMDAGAEGERMLYYQGWALAANYQIKTRRPCVFEEKFVVCRITVTDDFGQALGYVATDTFTLNVVGELVIGASSEGDDPPVFGELFEWISKTKPQIMEGPCKAMFDGGKTPGDCAQAVAQAARDFMAVQVLRK